MKTVVICRHAKSDWPAGVPDIDRPLKGRGIKDARRQGELLKSHGFLPDIIVSSPANRAHSTAKIVAETLGFPQAEIQVDESVYYQGTGNLISLIQDLPANCETAMFFGHNPTMENAVAYLLQTNRYYEMPTAGMVCFETYVSNWSGFDPSNASLRWVLVPRLKRKEH